MFSDDANYMYFLLVLLWPLNETARKMWYKLMLCFFFFLLTTEVSQGITEVVWLL